MTQKQDTGCPLGYMSVVVSNGFVEDIEKRHYGYFPWYAMPRRRGTAPPPLPKTGLCMISLNKRYNFDIRGIGGIKKMYAMSGNFWEHARGLQTNFHEFVPASFLYKDGSVLANQRYIITRPDRLSLNDSIDHNASDFEVTQYGPSIRKLSIQETLEFDLFTLDTLSTAQDSIFCSEQAVSQLDKSSIKGIQFTELSSVNWPKPSGPADTSELLHILGGESPLSMMMI
jgi:hypothetical protein